MILSAKSRYAVLALTYLAKIHKKIQKAAAGDSYNICLPDLAAKVNIPINVLEQIFMILRRKNFVSSMRGAKGGYRLAKAANEIFVSDILLAMDEKIKFTSCDNSGSVGCGASGTICDAHELWAGLHNTVMNYCSKINLQNIIDGQGFKGFSVMPTAENTSDQKHKTDQAKEEVNLLSAKLKNKIYLDHNAATFVRQNQADHTAVYTSDEATKYAYPLNAASVHFAGQRSKNMLEKARTQILQSLNLDQEKDMDVVFTASATEANNIVLQHHMKEGFFIIYSAAEHASVAQVIKNHDKKRLLPADLAGNIDLPGTRELLQSDDEILSESKILFVISYASSESGVVQQVEEIQKIIANLQQNNHAWQAKDTLFHSDAVGAFGRMNTDFTGIDYIILSSHKIGGPFGAGALIYNKSLPLKPLIFGGGQEKYIRPGTENIPAIMAFADMLHEICSSRKHDLWLQDIGLLRDKMEDKIKKFCPEAIIVGKKAKRVYNTSLIIMPAVSSSLQLIHFDLHDIAVSAGSACSSGKVNYSDYLLFSGYDQGQASSAIRVSLGRFNTAKQIDDFVNVWQKIWLQSGGKKKKLLQQIK